MSHTLARQKLEAAISAMRCAKTNIDQAAGCIVGDHRDDRLASAALNLLSLSVEEFTKAARDAHDAMGLRPLSE